MLSAPGTGIVLAGKDETLPGFWPTNVMVPHLAEFVAGLVAFIVVLIVAKKVAVPAFEKMYDERRAAVEGGMQEAEAARAEADELKTRYQAQLAEAKAEAASTREDARAEAAEIVVEARERATAEATRITEAAGKQVEAERQQAMVQLRGDVGSIATDLASRVVGESLEDSARQSGVIDRFLAELEQADPAAVRGSATPSQGL